jgi:uncharacterized protein YraI
MRRLLPSLFVLLLAVSAIAEKTVAAANADPTYRTGP